MMRESKKTTKRDRQSAKRVMRSLVYLFFFFSLHASLSQDRQQKEAQNTRRLTRENDILCVETKESTNQSKEERKREKKADVRNPDM